MLCQTPDKATKRRIEDAVSTRTQRLTQTPDKATKRRLEDDVSRKTQRLTQTPDKTANRRFEVSVKNMWVRNKGLINTRPTITLTLRVYLVITPVASMGYWLCFSVCLCVFLCSRDNDTLFKC